MKLKIKWSTKQVSVDNIKPTPNNYKIKTDLGLQRLQHSLNSYGLAGTVICNTDLTLIDGNSRLEQAKLAGEKKIWVSLPDRKLSPKEFQEMSAMYDVAKAGEVDMERIEKELGTTKQFYDNWMGGNVPMHLLDKMGGKASKAVELLYPEEGDKTSLPVSDIKMVQLFFSDKQEKEFRILEAKLAKKFKTENTTDTVLKAFKSIK